MQPVQSLLCAGWPSAFTNEDLSILEEIIEANTSLYLDQMQQKLSYKPCGMYAIVWLRHMSHDCFGNVLIFTKICKGL